MERINAQIGGREASRTIKMARLRMMIEQNTMPGLVIAII
jgi:hypothetical protein